MGARFLDEQDWKHATEMQKCMLNFDPEIGVTRIRQSRDFVQIKLKEWNAAMLGKEGEGPEGNVELVTVSEFLASDPFAKHRFTDHQTSPGSRS